MTFASLFEYASQEDFFSKTPSVLIITSQQYPLLFFSLCEKIFKKKYDIVFSTLAYDISYDAFVTATAITFLGRRNFIFLKNIKEYENSVFKKKIKSFLLNYNGPHVICVWFPLEEAEEFIQKKICFTLDNFSKYEKDLFISNLVGASVIAHKNEILKKNNVSTIEQELMVLSYAAVLSKSTSSFFVQEWLDKIIIKETSLFDFAQYFFARRSDKFWSLWFQIKDTYSIPFWIVFWSEHIWKAYYVIDYYKSNRITESRSLTFKLPFSFIQKDWKTISLSELKSAHSFLYKGDSNFKSGSSEVFLELFYALFLEKLFI